MKYNLSKDTDLTKKIKVLVYDLEVSPLLIWAYGTYDTNALKVEKQSHIFCFSYGWLDVENPEVMKVKCVAQYDFPARFKADSYDDYDVVKSLYSLMEQADITLGYNVDGFDDKVSTTRFLYYNFKALSPHKSIDPLKTARSKFKLPNNKLNTVAQYFGLGEKTTVTHSDLWYDCLLGSKKAWRDMKTYCNQDVVLVKDVYMKLRPYVRAHPNLATMSQRPDVCPTCLGTKFFSNGLRTTQTMTYRRFVCANCGATARERVSDKDAGFEKPTYVSV